MTEDMGKRYNFSTVEEKWFRFWEQKGYFKPAREGKTFVIMMPPPNITGILHMGHVLNNAIQDVLARWHRMRGDAVLWQPGIDHAGIATQNKVEQALAHEGKTRFDIGREEFLRRTWAWKKEYGNTIVEQLRRLGASADWDSLVFTLDEAYSKAVLSAFVRLFNEGLVYRGKRLINWCPRCGTALSDEEVEHENTPSHLWFIRYPLADGSGAVVVATTRPETYLGDTAVAVNPADPRYKDLVGKHLRLPLVKWERRDPDGKPVPPEIPVLAHHLVDPDFGTGAVKVTPAHDFNDYEIARDASLPMVEVLDPAGRMNDNAGPYRGMSREEARERIVQDLREGGFLERTEDYTVPLGRCYRCGTAVEPRLSEQWFVRMKELAQPAIRAVREGRVRIIPPHGEKIFFHWMDNIKDWCVSRQIWWGHRIPVFYCDDCGHTFASLESPSSCPKCNSTSLRQDEDVLDTWASSWLWPFATLGWPERTERLARFYPGDVLVTGWEILFFWVARMIMAGEHFMGQAPFHTVYLHGIVRDQQGRKFSKSLGNSPDPLDLFARYSVDGVRMGLLLITPEGKDILFSEKSTEAGRNFANKLWNAARLLLSGPGARPGIPKDLLVEDRWCLSRYDACVADVTGSLENFEFNRAAKRLYDFFWREFCDWYLEAIKPRTGDGDTSGLRVALAVLEGYLRLLHPFMPFITEEIWQRIPGKKGESIVVAPWPRPLGQPDPEAERDFALLQEMITGLREIRSAFRVPRGSGLRMVFRAGDRALALARERFQLLSHLAGAEGVEESDRVPEGSALIPSKGFEAYVPLAGLVDLDQERARIARELSDLGTKVARARARLSDGDFLEKAPRDVINQHRARLGEMEAKLHLLEEQIRRLGT